MATRKDRVRRRFLAVIEPQLDVGEEVVASAGTRTATNYWIMLSVSVIVFIAVYELLLTTTGIGGGVGYAAAGVVGCLVAGLLSERPYFMAITDRRVFLVKASSMLGRPRGVRFVDPRSAVKITSAKSGVLGSQFAYCRASARPTTMYFSRPWREDMQAIVRTMTGESQLAAGDEAARH